MAARHWPLPLHLRAPLRRSVPKLVGMTQPLEPNWAALASGMPCDEGLLAEVGRVHWAAARLHAGVRDAINFIDGAPSDAPFRDWTLGSAITKLEQRAQKFVDGPDRDALIRWCRDVGRPAKHHRDAVAHAITYTATDGRQAIMTNDHSTPGRFERDQLHEVTGRLVDASMRLPPPPYRLL